MWKLDYKESWAPKNWCFWTVVLEKTLESPLGCKEIKPVNPKGNQSWIFIGTADAEAEAPILWPPGVKNWLTGKNPDAGKDWRWEEKGTTEDKMVGWYQWLDGHEFEQAPGVGGGQGILVCCSPWGPEELDTTEQLNWGSIIRHSCGPCVVVEETDLERGWVTYPGSVVRTGSECTFAPELYSVPGPSASDGLWEFRETTKCLLSSGPTALWGLSVPWCGDYHWSCLPVLMILCRPLTLPFMPTVGPPSVHGPECSRSSRTPTLCPASHPPFARCRPSTEAEIWWHCLRKVGCFLGT